MTFVIGVGLLIVGYTLLDWGHYVAQGKRVSLWYLISGQTAQEQQQNQNTPDFSHLPWTAPSGSPQGTNIGPYGRRTAL